MLTQFLGLPNVHGRITSFVFSLLSSYNIAQFYETKITLEYSQLSFINLGSQINWNTSSTVLQAIMLIEYGELWSVEQQRTLEVARSLCFTSEEAEAQISKMTTK